MLHAAFLQDTTLKGKKMMARDQAVLWLLFETGITAAEIGALRVCDLDRTLGTVRVGGKEGACGNSFWG